MTDQVHGITSKAVEDQGKRGACFACVHLVCVCVFTLCVCVCVYIVRVFALFPCMSLVRMCLSLSVILSAFLSACPSPCVVSCPLHVSIPSLTSDPFFCRPQSQSGRSTLWESGSRQHTTWVMIRCRHQNLVNENVMSEPTCFFNRYASAQAATHSTNFVHANTTSSSPSPCKTQLLLLLPTPPFLHLSPFKLSLSLNPLTSRPLDLSTSRPLSLNHTHTHTHTHSLSLSLSLSLTHTLSLSFSLSLAHTHTHTLSLFLFRCGWPGSALWLLVPMARSS